MPVKNDQPTTLAVPVHYGERTDLPLPPRLPRRSIVAIIADLSRPLPPECIARIEATAKRPAQDFLHWHTVAAILDTYAPGWEGEIVRIEKVGSQGKDSQGKDTQGKVRLAVTYRLTIHAAEGSFSTDGDGMEDEDKDDYGDAMTSAVATAMKRAAAKRGVGRALYDKDKKTAAFLSSIRLEKEAAFKELATLADAKGYARVALRAWVCRQAGVLRASDVPLYVVKALIQQLEAQPDVFVGDPAVESVPLGDPQSAGSLDAVDHINPATGEILDAWEEEEAALHQMPGGWLTKAEQHRLIQAAAEDATVRTTEM
jgi:hypothetical protein